MIAAQRSLTLSMEIATENGDLITVSYPADLTSITFCSIAPDVGDGILNYAAETFIFEVPQIHQPTDGCVTYTAPFTAAVRDIPLTGDFTPTTFETFPSGQYVLILRAVPGGGMGDMAFFFLSASPEAAVNALTTNVDDLAAQGALSQAQVRALHATLDAATRHVEAGRRAAAVATLQAFINQVQALVKAGVLSARQGQDLADAAQNLIDQLSRSP